MVQSQTPSDERFLKVFTFSFTSGKNQPKKTLNLKVNVAEEQNVAELAARVSEFHQIPCFVEEDLLKALKEFIKTERLKLADESYSACVKKFLEKPDSIEKISKSVAEKYTNTWAEYAELKQEDATEDLSSMYHKLIHSQAMTILLPLEEHYHRDVQKVLSDKQQSMTKLQERQELEMQRACEHVGDMYSETYVNELAAKHTEKTESLLSQWREQYSKIVNQQKQEYRGVISRLYAEMLANKGKVDEHGHTYMEVKKIIEVSAGTVDMYTLSSDANMFGHHSGPPSGARSSRRRGSHSSVDSNTATVSENLQDEDLSPLMEESFTINLGAQMKTMHNIRLVVAPTLHFCCYSNRSGDLQAQRLQTVMSLYSNSLSALVLLVNNNIDKKSRLKSEFAVACKSSTEFHFPSLKEQLAEIKCRNAAMTLDRLSLKSSDTLSTDSSSSEKSGNEGDFNDGDFYITKHSNLSRVHVVFHLCSNPSSLRSPESIQTVSSRHPVIMGLRHILKVMSSHDIGTLTVPLLLCHELSESIDEGWILKRAELVMKCMKGFMMEMATWDGGVSRTIQFSVPPGIDYSTFDRLVSMLPEIFRTTSARVLATGPTKKPAGSPKPSKKQG